MLISDLNYLNEVSSESTDLSGGFNLGYDFSHIYFNEYLNIYKNAYVNTYAKGHLATSESDANAYGYGTFTQTFNNANTTPFSSHSNGVAIAGTGY
ncbi:MAG: hypothetical protein KME11_20860 [Timaviella obliquedivisa GSE-PSE-MK23-08B]|jgi:hypothetical protein|nr:hypothetical protein [Timaviella obliquedivisa GSE-PSE-MK23-08B]